MAFEQITSLTLFGHSLLLLDLIRRRLVDPDVVDLHGCVLAGLIVLALSPRRVPAVPLGWKVRFKTGCSRLARVGNKV